MGLQQLVMDQMKTAMKAKDTVALESLRAIKSALLLAKTSGEGELSEEEEVKLVQKLVKQRKDSAAIFSEQGREDLAAPELAQVAVLEQFLPEQLTDEEIEKVVVQTITQTGATSMKDMGKVMGMVSKELSGQADGKTISKIVKKRSIEEKQKNLHIFSASPVALMFFLGQLSRSFGKIVLYEYDFEGLENNSYFPSFKLPVTRKEN